MNRRRFFLLILFPSVLALGTFFRLSNISPNKIYPDSYQNVLVAQNIRDYHSVVGYLGNDGMLYPDFFAWTRPVYPLLILSGALITHNLTTSAQILAVGASILSLLVAFFLGKTLYKSNLIGISMMLLLAFSFNHTVWSGLILTEGVAVFFMLLFLTFLFSESSTKTTVLFSVSRGLLFTILFFTRYEYGLLIVPVLYYMRVSATYKKQEVLIFLTTVCISMASFLFLLFPLPSTLYIVFSQTQDLLQKSALFLLSGGVSLMVYRYFSTRVSRRIQYTWPYYFLGLLWLMTFLLVLLLLFPTISPQLVHKTSGIRNFLLDDLVLSCSFLLGITYMIRKKVYIPLLTFSLLSISLLYGVYFRTNPAMERYLTHLIPFLLLPAGYGLSIVIRTGKVSFPVRNFIIVVLIVVFLFQGLTTWEGIRNWGDKSWFSKSYDDQVAELTASRIMDKNTIILASFPEPYYYMSGLTTYSMSDTYPYIYIPDSLSRRNIIISEDMGMLDIFPNFTSFLDTQMQDRQIDTFFVNLPYHYGNYSKRETSPVILYKTTVSELKQRISTAKPSFR